MACVSVSEMESRAVRSVCTNEDRDAEPVQRFAEPVALSSTAPDDFPLPRTAVWCGFDLIALRARRNQQYSGSHVACAARPCVGAATDQISESFPLSDEQVVWIERAVHQHAGGQRSTPRLPSGRAARSRTAVTYW